MKGITVFIRMPIKTPKMNQAISKLFVWKIQQYVFTGVLTFSFKEMVEKNQEN